MSDLVELSNIIAMFAWTLARIDVRKPIIIYSTALRLHMIGSFANATLKRGCNVSVGSWYIIYVVITCKVSINKASEFCFSVDSF